MRLSGVRECFHFEFAVRCPLELAPGCHVRFTCSLVALLNSDRACGFTIDAGIDGDAIVSDDDNEDAKFLKLFISHKSVAIFL